MRVDLQGKINGWPEFAPVARCIKGVNKKVSSLWTCRAIHVLAWKTRRFQCVLLIIPVIELTGPQTCTRERRNQRKENVNILTRRCVSLFTEFQHFGWIFHIPSLSWTITGRNNHRWCYSQNPQTARQVNVHRSDEYTIANVSFPFNSSWTLGCQLETFPGKRVLFTCDSIQSSCPILSPQCSYVLKDGFVWFRYATMMIWMWYDRWYIISELYWSTHKEASGHDHFDREKLPQNVDIHFVRR